MIVIKRCGPRLRKEWPPLISTWRRPFCAISRSFHSTPFGDGLEPGDDDDLGLADFAHYVPAEIPEMDSSHTHSNESISFIGTEKENSRQSSLVDFIESPRPIIIELKLTDPFLNLAIEDYLFVNMPQTALRLFTYTNQPCVVVGKNQNPWKEVNLKALTTLGIPLVRRRSGGGTVVHDRGNLNYCFMSPQLVFDRSRFSQLVANSVNSLPKSKHELTTNLRGDIVTAGADSFKVGGSAFRLLRGKSYHHGTLLLSLRLDVMRKLLKRDAEQGVVVSPAAVDSVPAHVTNIMLETGQVTSEIGRNFKEEYAEGENVTNITVDESTSLPPQVVETARELREWSWTFGHTPRFVHKFTHPEDFIVEFHVGKHAILEKVHVDGTNKDSTNFVRAQQLFEVLQQYIDSNKLEYTGSNVAGFVTDDDLSEWIGMSIDGTD